MAYVTGISGNVISAASAAYAPTNEADVSAIASAYQVVSSVGDDGTYITSINGSALSGAGGGGATGDYVETSAINVTIGNSNVASSSSIAIGVSSIAKSVSFAQGSAVSASGTSIAQGNMVSAYAGSLAIGYSCTAKSDGCCIGHYNFGNNTGFAQGRFTTGWNTGFAQGSGVLAYNIGLGQGYNVTASGTSFAQGASLSAINNSFAQGSRLAAINYVTAFGKYNLHMDGDTSTGTSAAFVIGDGTADAARHDLMLVTKDGEITMYSSTADTVGLGLVSSIKAISAAATGGGGGGGVDSATVSSIASAYAESAVSSKLDASASSSFYTTANESGFITGVDLSPYQTTADMSSYIPTSMSSDFQQVTGMSSYALSADVSGTVDLVSTQSANWSTNADWAESASSSPAYIENKPDLVDIVAGPGIIVDNPDGNTLRVSQAYPTDETVLFTATNNNDTTRWSSKSLSETISNFERIRITWERFAPSTGWTLMNKTVEYYTADINNRDMLEAVDATQDSTETIYRYFTRFNINGSTYSESKGKLYTYASTAGNWSTTNCWCHPIRIVGIHRIANN